MISPSIAATSVGVKVNIFDEACIRKSAVIGNCEKAKVPFELVAVLRKKNGLPEFVGRVRYTATISVIGVVPSKKISPTITPDGPRGVGSGSGVGGVVGVGVGVSVAVAVGVGVLVLVGVGVAVRVAVGVGVGVAGSWQMSEQPSPLIRFASSHCSPASTVPFPHVLAQALGVPVHAQPGS